MLNKIKNLKNKHKKYSDIYKKYKINEKIKSKEVRVINSNGVQLGIMRINDALLIAKEQKLDLVEIFSSSNPPVCKIIDFFKFIYNENKKNKNSKLKNKHSKIKEIKFTIKIDENDLSTKLKQAKDFLEKGFKFKMTIFMRGREVEHKNLAFALLNKISLFLKDTSEIIGTPKLNNRILYAIFNPLKK